MDNKAKLTAAFATLRKQGFIARQNFSCCGSCAGYEIAEYVKELSPARQAKVKGAITYNRQSAENAFHPRWGNGHLYIGFGPVSVHEVGQFGLPTVEVGNALKAALEEQGLTVEWDGDPDKRIGVQL